MKFGEYYNPPGAISAVVKRSIGVVHIIEVRAQRVGHALFTQAIVVVDHGDGSAKGLSARSVDGNDVAGLVVGRGGKPPIRMVFGLHAASK